MGVSYDPGPVVEAIIDKLQAGMAAKLNTLDTEYDDFVLDDINKWYRARMGQYDAYPCQVVTPFGQGRIADQEAGFGTWAHPLVVVTLDVASIETATVGGDALSPIEVMQTRLGRYVRATVEILDTNRSLTIANSKAGGAILEIGAPNYLDFEYNTGDPSILRRQVAIPIDVGVQ